MALPLPWVRHLKDPESKENFERSVRGSTVALARLLSLLEEQEQTIHNQEASASDFEDPNWSHKQAFRNGQKNQLKELKKLLSFLKDKD